VFIRLVAVLVSICLSSASAFAETNGASAGAKKASPSASAPGSGGAVQVFLYWPRDNLEPGWAQNLRQSVIPGMEIHIDGKKISTIASGDYITAQVSPGKHTVSFRAGFFSLPMTKSSISVSGGTKHYYRIFRIIPKDDPNAARILMEEASEPRAAQALKELHKR
jgi:hypothetical protein